MVKQKFNFQLNPPTAALEKQQTSAAKTVPEIMQKLETNIKNPFDIKLIPRPRLRMNNKNSYPIEEVESLAKSILEYGLQQNLVVIYSAEEDKYILETGHRRVTALDMLINQYSTYENKNSPEYLLYEKNVAPYEKGYPCKVTYLEDGIKYDFDENADLSIVPESVIDSEIRLYITNEEVRTRTPAQTAQAVARLKQLYNAKNAKNSTKNHSEKINVNEKIAGDLKISSRQVAKYNAATHLIPELLKLFDADGITLTNADSYARLSTDEQLQIYNIIKNHDELNSRQLDTLIQHNKKLYEQVREKEARIEELSQTDTQAATNNELERLKNELHTLKEQQRKIQHENTALKNEALKNHELMLSYDALLAAAKRFLRQADQHPAINDTLEELISLTKELTTLEFSL